MDHSAISMPTDTPAVASLPVIPTMNADWLDLIDFDVDDDPEILRAALDFIESCDSSEGSDIGESGANDDAPPPVVAADVTAPTEQPPRPNKRRNPPKEEILDLRKRVATLEEQLVTTKRRMRIAPSQRLITSIGSDDTSSVDTSAIWEEIAKRQQKQRYLAELENVKLRNMVDNQLKIAGELTRVGRRQAFLQDYYEPMLNTSTPNDAPVSASVTMPGLQSASPLLVTIFPSKRTRPSLPMAATATPHEELPLEAWKPHVSDVVRGERVHAVRIVAWQSMLRQFLGKRRLGYSYDRLNEIIDTAVSPPSKNGLPSGLDARLVYTDRYADDDDKAASSATPAWDTGSLWKSPLSVVSALFAQQKSVNLRLFHLAKPRRTEDDGLGTSSTSSRPLQMASCDTQTVNDWQKRALVSQPLCLRVL